MAIAKKLGLDLKTFRGAISRETFSYGHQKPRPSKLDGFKDKIDRLLKHYPAMSAVRIFEEIQKMGYTGRITILRDYLRALKNWPYSWFYGLCGFFQKSR